MTSIEVGDGDGIDRVLEQRIKDLDAREKDLAERERLVLVREQVVTIREVNVTAKEQAQKRTDTITNPNTLPHSPWVVPQPHPAIGWPLPNQPLPNDWTRFPGQISDPNTPWATGPSNGVAGWMLSDYNNRNLVVVTSDSTEKTP